MTPVELSRTVLSAVRRAVDDGELNVTVPERAVVTVPGPGGCGDFATSIALQLARPAGQPARRVAEIVRARLAGAQGIRDVVVTGPGFLNISLDAQVDPVAGVVREIRRQGVRYGYGDALAGQVVALRVPYEVRAEVVADTVVRLVAAQGGRATVEHGEPVEPRRVPAPVVEPVGPRRVPVPVVESVEPRRVPVPVVESVEPRRVPVPVVEPVGLLTMPAAAEVEPVDTRPASTPETESAKPADSHPHPPTHPAPVDLRPVPAPEDPAPLGPDAARWALLHPAAHDRPRITAEHLVQREGNPLFRVRYAHARVRALGRNAARLGFDAEPGPVDGARGLIAPLADYPRILSAAAIHRAPDRLARHLVTVADAVLPLLPRVLPVGEEKPSAAHRARLALAEAAGTVLAGGLSLLGIDAPEYL
ncbi:ArgS-related anticodon-binding protein NrtL [Streptomyces capoamus]|uniref:ArgS-related anticodon-binding protein NrtL n=1 Tax=Streptomyces capoamus TaxID=68183 RepID=UPI003C2BF579